MSRKLIAGLVSLVFLGRKNGNLSPIKNNALSFIMEKNHLVIINIQIKHIGDSFCKWQKVTWSIFFIDYLD